MAKPDGLARPCLAEFIEDAMQMAGGHGDVRLVVQAANRAALFGLSHDAAKFDFGRQSRGSPFAPPGR